MQKLIRACCKHSLLGAEVLLAGHSDTEPLHSPPPRSYWSSVLWRQLVGTTVLTVQDGLAPGRTTRVYAFCGAQRAGSVTLVVLNSAEEDTATITLEAEQHDGPAGGLGIAQAFVMTSYPGVLTSREVFLNGGVLRLQDAVKGCVVQDCNLDHQPHSDSHILWCP